MLSTFYLGSLESYITKLASTDAQTLKHIVLEIFLNFKLFFLNVRPELKICDLLVWSVTYKILFDGRSNCVKLFNIKIS